MRIHEFDYEELEVATENFSPSNVIGRGSHGCVYRGILGDGTAAAIKKQSPGLQKLRDNSKLENESVILSSIESNPYLVNLIGTSRDSVGNSVLVMELMPNGTLHDSLHSSPVVQTWISRVRMAVQLAKAVRFLHELKPPIVHRDIKSANILFDCDWNAKLVDLGLAVRLEDRIDSANRPAGTIGYLDPCYTVPEKLSTKTDVFSFGVVLMEIVSGTKAIDVSRAPAAIVEWATPLIGTRRETEIYDRRVPVPRDMETTVRRLLSLAARCVSSAGDRRPSMEEIVAEMENSTVERFRFPLWMTVLRSQFLLKMKRRAVAERCAAAANTTTTTSAAGTIILCAGHPSGKLLVKEILADITLSS